jgi:tetratricopeptide (TPR) repeat protein
MSEHVELSDADTLALAVDIAETCLSLPAIPRHESNRQLTASESILTRYTDIQADDQQLPYRRDVALARIYVRRGRAGDAMIPYADALEKLDDLNDGEVTQNSADLCKEIAEAAEAAHEPQAALQMYKRAHAAYRYLGMHSAAKLLEPKINPQPMTERGDEPRRPGPAKDAGSALPVVEEEDSLNE